MDRNEARWATSGSIGLRLIPLGKPDVPEV